MAKTIELSAAETAIIRSWYEHTISNKFHFGGADVKFPTEQMLLNKIERHCGGPVSFTNSELACIVDWMDQAIGGKFGSDKFLFGSEEAVFSKISAAVKSG